MFYSILPMNTKFFTNDSDNALLNKFEGVFKYSNVHCFDALVGSFRSSGYLRIRPFLDKVPKVRIPLGIYVDQLVKISHERGLEFFRQEQLTREEFVEDLRADIKSSNYDKETEEGIVQFFPDIVDKKLEIRTPQINFPSSHQNPQSLLLLIKTFHNFKHRFIKFRL